MKTVGIREFRNNLSGYLDDSEPVAITRDGETIGFYLPAPRKRTAKERAELRRAATRFRQELSKAGMSEEELIEDFHKWRKQNRTS